MPRAFRLFYLLLAVTFALAACAVWVAHVDDAPGSSLELARFLLGGCLLGAAVASWGTAVFIAYVHRVTWPIVLLVGIVVIAGTGFAVWCHQNPTAV